MVMSGEELYAGEVGSYAIHHITSVGSLDHPVRHRSTSQALFSAVYWRELARVKMHAGIFALGSRPYSLLG